MGGGRRRRGVKYQKTKNIRPLDGAFVLFCSTRRGLDCRVVSRFFPLVAFFGCEVPRGDLLEKDLNLDSKQWGVRCGVRELPLPFFQ